MEYHRPQKVHGKISCDVYRCYCVYIGLVGFKVRGTYCLADLIFLTQYTTSHCEYALNYYRRRLLITKKIPFCNTSEKERHYFKIYLSEKSPKRIVFSQKHSEIFS